MIDADDPSYRAYRTLVDARWDPQRVDRSDDRVRVARFDDDALDAVRTLLARAAGIERALVPATSRLAATRSGADAMALSAAATAAATRLDALVTYWDRVIDPEEHARGNDPTGLDADRWLDDASAVRRLEDTVTAVGVAESGADASTSADAGGVSPATALADEIHLVETLLARGLYDLLEVVADGDAAAPGLPGLAETVDGGRETVQGVALAVAGTGATVTDDPIATLRSSVPDVPGVAVGEVTAETASAYRASLATGQDGDESR